MSLNEAGGGPPLSTGPEWLQLKRVVTALLAHGFDRDCQSLLVDDVHLLAGTQGADEGFDLRVHRGNGSRQAVRPNEAPRAECAIFAPPETARSCISGNGARPTPDLAPAAGGPRRPRTQLRVVQFRRGGRSARSVILARWLWSNGRLALQSRTPLGPWGGNSKPTIDMRIHPARVDMDQCDL